MTEPQSEPQLPTPLEQREAEARIEKLEIEKKVLSLQLTKRYERREALKILAGLGGLVAAVAAIATFLFSTLRWQQESFDTRQVNIEQRFDRALERLGHESAGARLGGVVSMKSFLDPADKERHSRVLLSLSHALAIDRDPIVRDAIIAVFDGVDTNVVDKQILDQTLGSLVSLNRAFYREGKLNRTRVQSGAHPKPDSLEAQAISTAAGIVALLRKGARTKDLSGIYCVRCDFSKMDLSSTNFDDDILELASFSRTVLVDCSFNRADLENANFFGANLERAKLGISGMPWYQQQPFQFNEDKTDYSWDRLDEDGRVIFPDFTCVNLKGADFSGRPLGIETENWSSFTNLKGSNLERTKLDDFVLLVEIPEDAKHPAFRLPNGRKVIQLNLIDVNASSNFDPDKDPGDFLDTFRETLEASNWRQAQLDPGLLKVLIKEPPSGSYAGPCTEDGK